MSNGVVNGVKIGGQWWRFRTVHGQQLVKAEGESSYTEYAVIRDDEAHTISVSDTIPLDCQLAEAAREAVLLMLDAVKEALPKKRAK